MTESNLPEIVTSFTGDALKEAITKTHPERKALIDGLVYEKSALMLYADDGCGKSVLLLQACMQSTVAESKVFEEFNVPRACSVLYYQMERDPVETFERMKHLVGAFPFDPDKFCLSVELQGMNLQTDKGNTEALSKVLHTAALLPFIPDIVAFDPIYTMTVGGLETAEACNAITGFFRLVQLALGCTIIATSHTNRGIRSATDEGRRVGKDMYGNRFLSAFFTGSYHITSREDGAGSSWKLDKNSQKNLEKQFDLVYDASCYRSFIKSDSTKLDKKDKLDMFLKSMKHQNKTFDIDQMMSYSGLSPSKMRGHLGGYLKPMLEIVSKSNTGKHIYRVRD